MSSGFNILWPMARELKTSTLVQSCYSILHVFEADVGVHIRRRGWGGVTKLFLDLPQVAGFPQQMYRYRMSC